MNKALVVPVAVFVFIVGVMNSTFVINQWQQAIVVQMGRHVGTYDQPGLHFKIPFIQKVIKFEKRLLEYDANPKELITLDKQQVVVDNYSRWRIVNPLMFFTSVRTEDLAQSRLDDIIFSVLREELGKHPLRELVSGDRESILNAVLKESRVKAREYGIEIADVRIKRADLPEKNRQNVFGRMRTERQRIAKKYRAEGEEEARKIRSSAQKEARIIQANAKKESEILRGEGDAKSTKIYARAYNRDPEFYSFVRNLEAYRKTLGKDTTIIMSPKNQFLQVFERGR